MRACCADWCIVWFSCSDGCPCMRWTHQQMATLQLAAPCIQVACMVPWFMVKSWDPKPCLQSQSVGKDWCPGQAISAGVTNHAVVHIVHYPTL
jgi:hypothetical protein